MQSGRKHFDFSYLPLLVRLRCCETARLPEYLGSTLHGVLGWTLKPEEELYRYLFENRRLGGGAQDIVNPYLIDPPRPRSLYRAGERLDFGVTLLGNAAEYAGKFVEALAEKKQFQLGAAKKPFELTEILHGETFHPLWRDGTFQADAALRVPLPEPWLEGCTHCAVQLQTPLRIRRGGKLVTELDFPTLVRNITRRLDQLTRRYGGAVNQEETGQLCESAKQVRTVSNGLYVSPMHRYSSRREQSMEWDGVLGAVTFEGDVAPFTPWLEAARILHIGRNVTLGFGKIEPVVR